MRQHFLEDRRSAGKQLCPIRNDLGMQGRLHQRGQQVRDHLHQEKGVYEKERRDVLR